MGPDTQFLRLPININYNGKIVCAEITGSSLPLGKYFTCRIPGADMIIFEAVQKGNSGEYSWGTCYGKQLGYQVPFIGKEIEKQLNKENKFRSIRH
jgi:hypothetical protein